MAPHIAAHTRSTADPGKRHVGDGQRLATDSGGGVICDRTESAEEGLQCAPPAGLVNDQPFGERACLVLRWVDRRLWLAEPKVGEEPPRHSAP